MTTPTSSTLVRRDVATPLGPLTLVAADDGLRGAYFADHRRRPELEALEAPATHPALDRAERAFAAYFAGEAADVPVDAVAPGTPFQREVWEALRDIPAGRTWTYTQVAARIGRPTATRAVAAAIGRNPLTVAVPCHRVVGADGALTGYAGGIERKRWLLAHERG
ncbi:methylated-DNA--[protein]-cysteine S-methyltransferase [Demequina sp. SYSU T00192]|uniref:Methylated-DNA--protein-cysteine methyltransferase n=1 Tax=Demequina litoralis TaxID=3051660 RepID=A0ABT8GD43_9MICO|nr:methylated-DNA--[protein]-cysteine S-methyltransferase [Demequina sp. SYSU T00192]MDN4476904.1 methylated-DNA--[protein]-cysteine S-methyltransferase [Demequina sp. SYSU T00192]